MIYRSLFLIILSALTGSVFATEQLIQVADAMGDTQNVIVDEGGSLKMVPPGSSNKQAPFRQDAYPNEGQMTNNMPTEQYNSSQNNPAQTPDPDAGMPQQAPMPPDTAMPQQPSASPDAMMPQQQPTPDAGMGGQQAPMPPDAAMPQQSAPEAAMPQQMPEPPQDVATSQDPMISQQQDANSAAQADMQSSSAEPASEGSSSGFNPAADSLPQNN